MPNLSTSSACIGILFCSLFIGKQLHGSSLRCSKIIKQKLYISELQTYSTDKLSTDSVVVKNNFTALSKYLAMNCRYPMTPRQQHLTGTVIIGFEVNDKQEVVNAKVAEDNNFNGGFADEVLNRFRKFKGTVKAVSGNYTYQVLFRFKDDDNSADKNLDYKKHAGTVLISAM